ncbi:hypothetical protein [Ornithinimicrobium kibberense]|uniref:hypothetical protein n=1 Tax=Ornithinimicrobium kibberense TaxID=282060 RepID=UPI003614B575
MVLQSDLHQVRGPVGSPSEIGLQPDQLLVEMLGEPGGPSGQLSVLAVSLHHRRPGLAQRALAECTVREEAHVGQAPAGLVNGRICRMSRGAPMQSTVVTPIPLRVKDPTPV